MVRRTELCRSSQRYGGVASHDYLAQLTWRKPSPAQRWTHEQGSATLPPLVIPGQPLPEYDIHEVEAHYKTA